MESIAFHSSERNHRALGEFGPRKRMLAESQVVDLCDSIAYTTHDIDDGLRANLINTDDLLQLPIWRVAEERAVQKWGANLSEKQLTATVVVTLIDWQAESLLSESQSRIGGFRDPGSVQHASENVIALDPELTRLRGELREFLLDRVYRHPQVLKTTSAAEEMIGRLFEHFVKEPSLMSEEYRQRIEYDSLERAVCDYIAGMTDRFASGCIKTCSANEPLRASALSQLKSGIGFFGAMGDDGVAQGGVPCGSCTSFD